MNGVIRIYYRSSRAAGGCKLICMRSFLWSDLLTRCRYSETIHLLYQKNTFDFEATTDVLRFSRVILPERMQLIKDVQWTYVACISRPSFKFPNIYMTLDLILVQIKARGQLPLDYDAMARMPGSGAQIMLLHDLLAARGRRW